MDDEQDYEQWIDAMEYYYEHLRELHGRRIAETMAFGTRYGSELKIGKAILEPEKLIIIGGE